MFGQVDGRSMGKSIVARGARGRVGAVMILAGEMAGVFVFWDGWYWNRMADWDRAAEELFDAVDVCDADDAWQNGSRIKYLTPLSPPFQGLEV